jgi:hypothetical protein
MAIFYPEAPEYFSEILEGLAPRTARRIHAQQMIDKLKEIAEVMALNEGEQPTAEKVQQLLVKVGQLSTLTVGSGYEHCTAHVAGARCARYGHISGGAACYTPPLASLSRFLSPAYVQRRRFQSASPRP